MSLVGALLLRGMLAGLLAGALALGFAELFGEPPLDAAIGFETAAEHHHAGEAAEPELVSRGVQRTLGLATAALTFGAALGGVLALVFAGAYGRVTALTPRSLAALLALAGFLALSLVPQLKYPANPPAIGAPGTIGPRTVLYFEMIAVSLGAMVLALLLWRRLLVHLGGWNAALAAAALFVVIVATVQLALPEVNEVPDGFPAVVLWRFRIASLGMQAVLWAGLGFIFGVLAEWRLLPQGRRVASLSRHG